MTPERLDQIEELYHSAREASVDERAALFDRADPELRHEVESLLAHQSDCLILDRSAQLTADPTLAVLEAGVLLGPYRVESKLGEGGMGEVFRAVDTRLDRRVAIKLAYQEFSARFEREARAISAMNHPHICTLYDVGPNYLVMELLEGETIAARLKNGPLPTEQALRFAAQIANALTEAHGRGIVHRDLKPGNIMLTRSGIKVLDFGLATSEGDETHAPSRTLMGTPAYMAPEQREGKPADARADIYSYGCVLYEMLTGARATPERTRVPSRSLERIVSGCLATDPARRWQTAAELANALEAAPGVERKRNWMKAAAGILVTLAVIGAGFFYFRPPPKLTDKDTIVLSDFVNNTGDSIFDGTLRQGLAIQLQQSPFLKIMDDDEVQSVARRMSLPPGGRITNQIAHEVCVRQGAAATVDGTIASVGKNYVVTVQAVSCQNGATLAREQIDAKDKQQVLKAVGIAASGIRSKLGESLNSIRKLNLPLEEATTPSLEALQNYTTGLATMAHGQFLPAVPLFERAIAIDPKFAMAYYYLGVGFEQAGDMARARDYAKKAFDLSGRTSAYERDQIAPYQYMTTGESDKAIEAYQVGIRDYPRWWGLHNNLSTLLIDLGRYEDALKEGLEATRLQADAEPPYRRQLDAYICLDRLPEAMQLEQRLQAQGIGGARIHQRFLEMAFIEDDQAAISREIQWFEGKPEEFLSFGLQAAKLNVNGHRAQSHALFQRAKSTALRRGLLDTAAEFDEADARADALAGNCQTVRRLGRPSIMLALCGDAVRAEKLAEETSKAFPNGTIWNAAQLPGIRAAIALNHDQPAESVKLLASALPYERAYLDVIYLRGLSYLQMNKGAEAADEFRKITDHEGASWASAWRYPYWGQFYSLSWLGVARGSALAGDLVNAQKAFQQFFELWKDADPGLPILQQAKAEYARLL
jgi:eukaryotic-like serine/threonine-protein kinase